MTARALETVSVIADPDYFESPALMGSLCYRKSRSGEIFSFEYDRAWLKKPEAFTFDPDLALVSRPQFPVPGRPNFGIWMPLSDRFSCRPLRE